MTSLLFNVNLTSNNIKVNNEPNLYNKDYISIDRK